MPRRQTSPTDWGDYFDALPSGQVFTPAQARAFMASLSRTAVL
jgi:hypothetical protein